MTVRACLKTVLVCFALGSVVSPAAAQPAAKAAAAQPKRDADAKARAQKHFERGVAAYKESRFKDAVDAFLDAHREYPSPSLSFNAARAYDKLLDTAGALRFYREYLRQTPEATDRASVETRVGELETKLQQERGRQQVTVLSNVEGATVRIDDQPVGVAPWTGEILPGTHKVKLTLDGYEDSEQSFELLAHRALDVTLSLRAKAAAPAEPKPEAGPAAVTVKPDASGGEGSARISWMTWTAFGVGAAALGGAGVFELMRASSEEDVKTERTQLARHDAFDRMESQQKTARIFAGVGAVAVVAGGVLLALDLSKGGGKKEGPPAVSVGCLPGSCSAAFAGRF
ncbi:MAG: PEGA domain-containing protein [Polyangiaceae bacterium]|nr:PEGA domain-containing protein [Polyangiaceae bacterium]